MSKNTVKTAVTRKKRGKRTVENPQYAAFTRRILRAYGRRIAAGDIEALRHLVLLPTDVDTITRTAVTGLREFGYPWSEIAARLGVSKQAAQARYGKPSARPVLDRRLVEAGFTVSVATLVAVFADHHPCVPASAECPECGYRYPKDSLVADCPTNATVRPLLYRRRDEDPSALRALTSLQLADLECRRNIDAPKRAAWAVEKFAPARNGTGPNLLDLIGGGDL
jgi:hypothetical protein